MSAAALPMPEFPPVMITVLPSMEGTLAAEELMGFLTIDRSPVIRAPVRTLLRPHNVRLGYLDVKT